MCELATYIKNPLTTGDVVNVRVGEIDTVRCEVIRVEYNYHGIDGLNKALVKSFNTYENNEYDYLTRRHYFNIVLQNINL